MFSLEYSNKSVKLIRTRFSKEYEDISEFYNVRRANRSNVLLMDHINQGLTILEAIHASEDAMRGFCLHPMTQNTEDLKNFVIKKEYNSRAVINALEYRHTANYCLSNDFEKGIKPNLSWSKDVNDMLIADKVQNRKDFIQYHYGTHEKSQNLDMYFKAWLLALGVTDAQYNELANLCGNHR